MIISNLIVKSGSLCKCLYICFVKYALVYYSHVIFINVYEGISLIHDLNTLISLAEYYTVNQRSCESKQLVSFCTVYINPREVLSVFSVAQAHVLTFKDMILSRCRLPVSTTVFKEKGDTSESNKYMIVSMRRFDFYCLTVYAKVMIYSPSLEPTDYHRKTLRHFPKYLLRFTTKFIHVWNGMRASK